MIISKRRRIIRMNIPFIVLLVSTLIIFNTLIFINNEDIGEQNLKLLEIEKNSVPVKRPPPTILMWNKIFGASLAESLLQYKNDGQCFYKCIYTDNRSLEQTASILVFHIRDNLDKMPEHRTPQQLYTFFILESPPHTWGLGRTVPPDFFNISMTYRADSDVYYPYDMFEEYTKKDLESGLVTYDQIWTENEVNN